MNAIEEPPLANFAVLTPSAKDRANLEPLRIHGPNALSPAGIPGLLAVRLRELHIINRDFSHITMILRAKDLFEYFRANAPLCDPIPRFGRLVEATFAFYFIDSPRPRSVVIRPPDTILTTRKSDAEIVQRWTSLHHFRFQLESCSESDEHVMAVS